VGAPSPQRAEFAHRLYEAWNAHGTKGIEPFVSEDLEWEDAPELPDAGTFSGRAAALGRLAEFEVEGHVLRMHVDIEEIRERGDHLLVVMMSHSSGGSSGAPAVETPIIHLLHFASDGRVDSGRSFMDSGAAEAAFATAGG
jgi:ketosteroid isomerase-like protein